jgi:hypothetical protein
MPSKRASRVGVTSFCNDILGTGYEAYGGIPGVIGGPKGMKILDWGFEFGHAGVWLFDFTWTGTALLSSSFLLQYLWHPIHCTSMYLFASSVLPFPVFHLLTLPFPLTLPSPLPLPLPLPHPQQHIIQRKTSQTIFQPSISPMPSSLPSNIQRAHIIAISSTHQNLPTTLTNPSLHHSLFLPHPPPNPNLHTHPNLHTTRQPPTLIIPHIIGPTPC